MPKTYTEGSCQTIQVDPENHLKKYNSLGVVASNSSIQTKESCDVDFLATSSPKDDRDEDLSDDDSSSEEQQELQRRLNPNRPEDFKTLRQELVQWRRREERKITIFARTEEHRLEMKKLLLKKEAHMLRKIGELQNSATDKLKTDKIEQMMTLMGQPKQMADSNGSIIIVDTPETRRAREMKAMYDDLNAKVENVSARIELLERIKALLEKIDHCGLVKDVGALLDRELQMLHIGTDLGSEFMDAMRKRLSNQFARLIRKKLNINNAGATHQKVTVKVKFKLHPEATN